MKAPKNGLLWKQLIFLLDIYPEKIIIMTFLLNALELEFYRNKKEHLSNNKHHNSALILLCKGVDFLNPSWPSESSDGI